jgi:2-haloacid dehalogenase
MRLTVAAQAVAELADRMAANCHRGNMANTARPDEVGDGMATLENVTAITVDVFGTTVDWRSGMADQLSRIAAESGIEIDGAAYADRWRARYLPALARVNSGERSWAYLDTLHREALDDLLAELPDGARFDEPTRERLVRAWHRLPAWPDAVEGLRRLRERYLVVAFSNGGFALLTNLIKAAGLPFDAIISAELAQAYKPDVRAYRTAAQLLDRRPDQLLMVAAHGWDLAGAREAGLHTAFIERPLEKGPGGGADRAEETACDLAATSFTDLARLLDHEGHGDEER